LAHPERVVDVHLAAEGVDEVALHGEARDRPRYPGGPGGINACGRSGSCARGMTSEHELQGEHPQHAAEQAEHEPLGDRLDDEEQWTSRGHLRSGNREGSGHGQSPNSATASVATASVADPRIDPLRGWTWAAKTRTPRTTIRMDAAISEMLG